MRQRSGDAQAKAQRVEQCDRTWSCGFLWSNGQCMKADVEKLARGAETRWNRALENVAEDSSL